MNFIFYTLKSKTSAFFSTAFLFKKYKFSFKINYQLHIIHIEETSINLITSDIWKAIEENKYFWKHSKRHKNMFYERSMSPYGSFV